MMDIIMSHIFNSYYTVRALESVGSNRRVYLVDNSFCGELRSYAQRHSEVVYIKPQVRATFGDGVFTWRPLTCADSWNLAMEKAESEWVINVNPDVILWPGALDCLELAIEGRHSRDVVLLRTTLGFNVWAGHRASLLRLGGFDNRFKPCAGEDEDILCRITEEGLKWSVVQIQGVHHDGGHKNRIDGYCNVAVFTEKWGFPPSSAEYKKFIERGRVA